MPELSFGGYTPFQLFAALVCVGTAVYLLWYNRSKLSDLFAKAKKAAEDAVPSNPEKDCRHDFASTALRLQELCIERGDVDGVKAIADLLARVQVEAAKGQQPDKAAEVPA